MDLESDLFSMEKKNILIIYSCLQDGAFLQQNISIVCQFVEELKNNNVIILTSFDTLKIAIQNKDVRIIVDKITDKSIVKIIKNEKINLIIPVIGDNDRIVKKIQNKLHRLKVVNLYEDYFTKNILLSKKDYNNINSKINNKLTKNIKKDNNTIINCEKIINVIAIKDKFKNQIILDILEYNSSDSTYTTWNDLSENKRYIQQKIDKIGKFLDIMNCLYSIKIKISNNKISIFNISYQFDATMIFFIQSKQLNIGKMMLNIFNKKQIINNLTIKNYCNFNEKRDLFYFNFLKTNINLDRKYSILENKKKEYILQYFTKNSYNKNFELNYIKHNNIVKNDKKYVLVLIDENFINDVNIQILFYKICNIINSKTGYNLLLLTKKNIILSSFLKEFEVIFYHNITDNAFKTILKKYNISNIFAIPNQNTADVLKIASKNNIKMYYLEKSDIDLFCHKDNELYNFCNKINIPYYHKDFEYKESNFHYLCITDKNKNVAFSTIISEHYQYNISTKCDIMPAIFINYDIELEINKIADTIIDNLSSYGLLDITFSYKKGDIFVRDISLFSNVALLFFQELKKDNNTLFEILTTSIIGEDIYKIVNKTKIRMLENFEKKCCFYNDNYNNQISLIKDNTKNKIIKKYKMLFGL